MCKAAKCVHGGVYAIACPLFFDVQTVEFKVTISELS